MPKMPIDESRRCAAVGMAIEISCNGFRDTKAIIDAAAKIEAYLKGGTAPEPKCFTQPDPTFKNEVLNDVDA